MARDLSGKRVAILATDGVERVELEQPRGALYGAGADAELLSIHPGEIQARQFDLVSAGTFSVDKLVTDASPDDYDALLLPEAPLTPTSCGSTQTRWRSSGPLAAQLGSSQATVTRMRRGTVSGSCRRCWPSSRWISASCRDRRT